jgi:hypothetical protein
VLPDGSNLPGNLRERKERNNMVQVCDGFFCALPILRTEFAAIIERCADRRQ